MAIFAATMVGAILRGRAGAPCACFGARSTVGWPAVARNALLAAAFAALPALPEGELSTDEWLGLGLGGRAARLRRARRRGARARPRGRDAAPAPRPRGGARDRRGGPAARFAAPQLIERFALEPEAELALAVFVSEGCHVCRALEPVDRGAGDATRWSPSRRFEEAAERGGLGRARDPGQPVRGRARPRGHGARQGDLQQPRPARERARRRRAPPGRARARGGRRCLSRPRAGRIGARSTRSPATPRGAASSPASAAR